MKRLLSISLATLMLVTNVMADTKVSVKLDDQNVEFANQQPVIVEGRTLIPLRGVFEKLGYSVEWQANTKTAVLKNDTATVTVTVNAGEFDVNGEKTALDIPAQIINGSMMLPLRAIGEASGLKVGWDNEKKMVSLTTPEKTIEIKVEVSDEISSFYDNVNGLVTLFNFYDLLNVEMDNINSTLIDGVKNKTLATSKALSKIEETNTRISGIYKHINSLEVPDDFKESKFNLLNIANDAKKSLEIMKNEYNGIYPDETSVTQDLKALVESEVYDKTSFASNMDKLSNAYERVMFKYFDTEKDTDEHKKDIEEFNKNIEAIDEKYPLPEYQKEDGTVIFDNIKENVELLKKSVEGRKEAYQNMEFPQSCRKRMELIICSTNNLSNIANALENYKSTDDEQYNENFETVNLNVTIYDLISTLATDGALKQFFPDDEKKTFDFDINLDENTKNVDMDTIVSEETKTFTTNLYYIMLLENYDSNVAFLTLMGLSGLNQEGSTTENDEFYSFLNDNCKSRLNIINSMAVTDDLKTLKSYVINDINLTLEYLDIMKQYATKKISEERYNTLEDALIEKLNSLDDKIDGEYSRLNTKFESYLYDYCDISTRTVSAEVKEFGKQIQEINKKYPISIVSENLKNGEISISDIEKIKSDSEKIIENIAKREADYQSIEVPDSCQKRLELMYAVDGMIVDRYNECKNIDADEAEDIFKMIDELSAIDNLYATIVEIATGEEVDSLVDTDN